MGASEQFLFSPTALDPMRGAIVVDESGSWSDKELDGFRVLLLDGMFVVQIRVDGDEHAVTIPIVAALEALEEQTKEKGC